MAQKNKPRVKLLTNADGQTILPNVLPAFQRAAGKLGFGPNQHGYGSPFPAGQVNRTYNNVQTKPVRERSKLLVDVTKPYIPPKPLIQYTYEAHEKMRYLVTQCATELGWVGAIEQVNPLHYIIHDIRVMEQMGAPATFKYDDWNDAVTEMIMAKTLIPGRVDANLGHSHVTMGVNPSGTDTEQMMDLAEMDEKFNHIKNPDGTVKVKYSIQTIHNKQGDSHAAVYDWENGKFYPKATVEVLSGLTAAQIADLDEQLKRVKPYTYANTYEHGAYGASYYDRFKRGESTYGQCNKPKRVTEKDVLKADIMFEKDVFENEYEVTMETWTDAQWELWMLGYKEHDISSGQAAKEQADWEFDEPVTQQQP